MPPPPSPPTYDRGTAALQGIAEAAGLPGERASEAVGEGKQEPGTIIRLVSGEGPVVECGHNSLVLLQVQPEGKKSMSAWSWWQGARLKLGDKLG